MPSTVQVMQGRYALYQNLGYYDADPAIWPPIDRCNSRAAFVALHAFALHTMAL
jgi:hypothetical protein